MSNYTVIKVYKNKEEHLSAMTWDELTFTQDIRYAIQFSYDSAMAMLIVILEGNWILLNNQEFKIKEMTCE